MRLGGGRRTQKEGMCVCVCTRVHACACVVSRGVGSLAHMLPPAPIFSDPFLYPGSALVNKTA